MKLLPSLFFLLIFQIVSAQRKLTDITKDLRSADRVEILSALDKQVVKDLDQKVTIVVSSLRMKDNYAFLKGNVKDGNANNIDFRQTVYKDSVDHGSFKGDEIFALLKKTNCKWSYLTHVIGPMDTPYNCWWQKYSAPRALFGVNKNCGDKY